MLYIQKDLGPLQAKSWCDDIEPGAMDQIKNLCNHPYLVDHIAVLPDCHQGYGMPIGTVIASKDVVIPNAVGVDIGCGMCAVKSTIGAIDRQVLKKIMGAIRSSIPLGFEHRRTKVDERYIPQPSTRLPVVEREYQDARTQIGTLGGGNHFIEFQRDQSGNLWIMIHSGSRHLGKTVADYYNRLAVKLDEEDVPSIPRSWQLSYLRLDTKEGGQYIDEMSYCVDFAFANRKFMMQTIMDIVQNEIHGTRFDPMINIAHNYAAREKHFGDTVWVHRKGATLASKETVGIIPGSQGAKSYIVRGKGNIDSFESCSHGAGRKMGRNQARRNLDLKREIQSLDEKGILHSIRGIGDLDEAASAYKDIETVMRSQNDLVDILVELTPLGVIKG